MRALPLWFGPLGLFGLSGLLALSAPLGCSAANESTGAGGATASSTATSSSETTSITSTTGSTASGGGAGGATTTATTTTTTSGAGGSGGAGGTGGDGGGAGGDGGSGGGAASPGDVYALFGAGTQGAAASAWFDAVNGWSVVPHPSLFADEGAATALQNGDVLVVARQASLDPLQDDLLLGALWSGGAGAGFSGIGAAFSAKGRPALGGFVDTAELVFLGQDNKHYGCVWNAGVFAPPGPVPAGMVQIQAFGPSPATIATNGSTTYAAYAGNDEQLYYVSKTSPGGAWMPSSLVPTSLVKNALPPALVVDPSGHVYFFYVRKNDAKVAFVKLIVPQMAWSAESLVDTNALTMSPVTAALTATGDVLVAWHGYNDDGLYFTRGSDAGFAVPAAIEVPAGTSTAPLALGGVAGADAEVLYGTGGNTARHARLVGAQWDISSIPGITALTFVAATRVE